ncbi:MAG: glycosyltransferase family 9 protein [Flavobacteriales bacterium]|nr:glycosyltransferase family 9 protein [Flavobacteriales bacterium]
MKILVVRFSSIGDIVLTTPVFRCVKNQVPNVEIHFLTKKSYAGLLKSNPYIDKIWSLNDDFSTVASQLKQEKFDLILDLHNNLRTSRLKFFLGVKTFKLRKLNVQKWLLTNFKINKLPPVHIVDRYLDTAKSLGIKNDHRGLDYFIDAATVLKNTLPEKFVCYAIGGQHATKKLPSKKIVELCQKIPIPVVVIGGREDQSEGHFIENQCKNVSSLCGLLNIDQSALVMQKAEWIITHDTGMMHIAAALKKKIISIWGNTVPEFGMTPYLPDEASKIFEVQNLPCRPCSKLGHPSCPKKHFNCMNKQDLQAISEVVK